jgi:hypothetical protein
MGLKPPGVDLAVPPDESGDQSKPQKLSKSQKIRKTKSDLRNKILFFQNLTIKSRDFFVFSI